MPLASAAQDAVDVDTILESLSITAASSEEPVLVLCVGLPGTGKSTFARRLAAETDALVLESDALRVRLFGEPVHSPAENTRLFRALHAAAGHLLSHGISVIVDATSLRERDRRPIYAIADEANARLLILRFDVPRSVAESRLNARSRGPKDGDHSTADITVYNRLEDSVQTPSRDHWRIDTSEADATETIFQRVVEACRPRRAAGTGGRV